MNNFHKIIFFIFFISFINAKEKYSIFISVSDLNQDPIKNAKVKLLDKNGKKVDNTKSNKSGKALFKKIQPGSYTLIAEHKKLGVSEIKIDILDQDKTVEFSIPSNEKLSNTDEDKSISNLDNEIIPEGLFVVSGKVVDKEGNGIKKADIRLKNDDGEKVADTKSKKNGAFELKKVSSGYYVIQASKKKVGDGFVRVKVWGNDIETQITIPSDMPPKLEQNSLSESNILGTINKKGQTTVTDSLPQQRDPKPKPKLEFDNLFFQYESNLKALQSEIDSLKTVVMAYDQQQKMPSLTREILDAINLPNFHHRIELQNGTVVLGNIEEESDSSLTLSTQIGRLVLEKQMVVRMDEHKLPAPNVTFLGEPFVDYYPDRQQFSGRIKNVGEKRADFVRVVGNLFDQTTSVVGLDSIFIKGTRVVYNSSVITDTALEPGQTATYKLIIPIKKGGNAQYHTMEIHWEEIQ